MGADRVAGEQRSTGPRDGQAARRTSAVGREELRRPDHLSAQNLLALQRSAGNRTVVQLFSVYRGGSTTDGNLTPRAGRDTTGPKRGLSTFESPGAIKNYSKAQIIETDNLGVSLQAVRNGTGPHDSHVSILPADDPDDAKLINWAAQKSPEFPALTEAVRGAITAEWRPDKK